MWQMLHKVLFWFAKCKPIRWFISLSLFYFWQLSYKIKFLYGKCFIWLDFSVANVVYMSGFMSPKGLIWSSQCHIMLDFGLPHVVLGLILVCQFLYNLVLWKLFNVLFWSGKCCIRLYFGLVNVLYGWSFVW